jgi:uncharacterized protein (DUF1778 family)
MANSSTARIDLRVRADLKELLEEAADLSAQTLAGFVAGAAISQAKKVVESAQRVRLSRADAEAFLAVLDRPINTDDALGRMMRAVIADSKPARRIPAPRD